MKEKVVAKSAFELFYEFIVSQPDEIKKNDIIMQLRKCQKIFKSQIVRAYTSGYENYVIPRRCFWTGEKYFMVKYGDIDLSGKGKGNMAVRKLISKIEPKRFNPYTKSYKRKTDE